MRPALVCHAVLLLVAAALAEDPKPSDKPPYQRLLHGKDAEKAERLEEQAKLREAEDAYGEAIKAAEEVLALRQRLQGDDHWETATARWDVRTFQKVAALPAEKRAAWRAAYRAAALAQDRALAGNSTGTLPPLQKWLTLTRDVLGDDHPDTAKAASLVANVLDDLSKPAEAQALYRQALARYAKALGEDHVDTALCVNSLAGSLRDRGQYAEAEALFRKARAAFQQALGEEHPYVLTTSSNLAAVLFSRGKHPEAEVINREILARRRRLFGEEHEDTAMSYNNLAAALSGQGKFAEAELHYRTSLALRRKLHGEDHPETARACNNLAENLSRQDRFAEADPLYREALAIRRKVRGEDHQDTGQSYSGVAFSLQNQSRYAAAEPLFRKALAINQKVWGERHHNTARGYNNLADNLDHQGNRAEAEALFRKALAIWQDLRGDHDDTAIACDNLAHNLTQQGRFAEAESFARQAVAIRLATQGERHPLLPSSRQTLALVLSRRGEHAEAESLLRAALAAHLAQRGDQPLTTAALRNALAIALELQGRFGEAESLYRQALSGYRRVLGEDTTNTATSYRNLAACLRSQGKHAEAIPLWESAARSFEAVRLRAAATGLDRALFAAQGPPSPALTAALARAGRDQEAWQALEAYLGRGLLDELSERRPTTLRPEEARRREALDRQLKQLGRQILPLVRQATPAAADQARLEQLLGERAAREAELADLAVTAARREVAELSDVQARLSADAAYVAWVDVADRPKEADPSGDHWACVVRRAGPPSWVKLAGSGPGGAWTVQDDDLPLRVVQTLSKPSGAGTPTSALQRLHAQRLAPLEPHLQAGDGLPPVHRLLVCSAGRMAGVPLEALTDRYDVSYVPSGSLLARLTEGPGRPPTGGALLAVGDPVFTPPQGTARYAPLAGTRREVEALVPLFARAEPLLGSDASEQRLEQLARDGRLKDFRYLHFATHGHIDWLTPKRSALILAQDRLPDALEQARAGRKVYQGRLTVADVLDTWQLDASLVTLSACETALGRSGGGDGFVGFSQALLAKGARSVVLSLWQVEDTATALFMQRFYQNLLGKRDGLTRPLPKAVALREAKTWLRGLTAKEVEAEAGRLPVTRGVERPLPTAAARTREARPFGHPYYWSAFILLGDPD
jgi:CHAT domain-containing protein